MKGLNFELGLNALLLNNQMYLLQRGVITRTVNLDSVELFVLQKLVPPADNREKTNSVYDQNNKCIIFNHLSVVFQVGLAGFANNIRDSIEVKPSAVAGAG